MNYQVFMTYNTDLNGDRISEKIYNTTFTIYSNKIVLDQIPDNYDGVKIFYGAQELTEIKNMTQTLGIYDFKVDYSTGIVYFHSDLEGVTVNVSEYSGIGYVSYPIDRIYSKTDGTQVTETLKDIISAQVREFIFSTEEPPVDASEYKEGSVWFVYEPNV